MRPMDCLTRRLLPRALAVAVLSAPCVVPAEAQQSVAAPEVLDIGECPGTASGFETGNVYRCTCAPNADTGPIYGSDLYTDDSHICTAAVHAGVLKQGTGGALLVRVAASPRVFKGLTRNGIKSEVWLKPTSSAFEIAPVAP